MESNIYNYLEAKISDLVDDLNNDLNLFEQFKRKEYQVSVPLLEEFNNHGEQIKITYDTYVMRRNYVGKPVIASIRKGEDGGLDGKIYNHKKKVREPLKEIIHSLAHKYNIATGNLL